MENKSHPGDCFCIFWKKKVKTPKQTWKFHIGCFMNNIARTKNATSLYDRKTKQNKAKQKNTWIYGKSDVLFMFVLIS